MKKERKEEIEKLGDKIYIESEGYVPDEFKKREQIKNLGDKNGR